MIDVLAYVSLLILVVCVYDAWRYGKVCGRSKKISSMRLSDYQSSYISYGPQYDPAACHDICGGPSVFNTVDYDNKRVADMIAMQLENDRVFNTHQARVKTYHEDVARYEAGLIDVKDIRRWKDDEDPEIAMAKKWDKRERQENLIAKYRANNRR